jgi:hypothetical protein
MRRVVRPRLDRRAVGRRLDGRHRRRDLDQVDAGDANGARPDRHGDRREHGDDGRRRSCRGEFELASTPSER